MEMEKLIKIVSVMSMHLFKGININQIAKESGVSVASTFRILKKIRKKNEVKVEKAGNNILYRLNLRNPFTLKYCEIASIKKREHFFLKKPEYYDTLINLRDAIKQFSSVLGIFGSIARMEEKPADLDIFIIYKSDIKPIQKIISKTKSKIPISPFYITKNEFKEKIKEEVISNIIKEIIILYGESEFWNILLEVID